ncbi:hypothetical protein Esti_005957 [Eimeria stiedai]
MVFCFDLTRPLLFQVFMREALAEAQRAAAEGEVPVGCVLVCPSTLRVVARGSNKTNLKSNATRHCELEAIDDFLNNYTTHLLQQKQKEESSATLAAAAAAEAREALASLHLVHAAPTAAAPAAAAAPPPLQCKGGICAEEAVELLRVFYSRGNPHAPTVKRKRPLCAASEGETVE